MKKLYKILVTLSLVILTTPQSQAWDFNKSIREQQQAKEAKRWSLSEWLSQKQRNKLMDTWLFYNQPSPYEFFLSVDTASFDQELSNSNIVNSQAFRNYRAGFGAFVTMVGLYGEYETSDEELEQWKALFMLRLLGSSDQSTNLTIHYGLINQTFNEDPTQFQVGGGSMNLYVVDAFAFTGRYDYFMKATSEAGLEQQGSRFEAGAFIEYGALRLYGSWFQENMEVISSTNGESTRIRKGILFGARFYF